MYLAHWGGGAEPSPAAVGEPSSVVCVWCVLLPFAGWKMGNPEENLNTWRVLHLKRLISPHSCICSSNCFRNVVLSQAFTGKCALSSDGRAAGAEGGQGPPPSQSHTHAALTCRRTAGAPLGTKTSVSVGTGQQGLRNSGRKSGETTAGNRKGGAASLTAASLRAGALPAGSPRKARPTGLHRK